ncbi:MAG TPA: glycosyltransferase family 9 protein [Chloroflexota bacterium]|jgi:heptosyltransferase-2|nr:glycosyltransferase family 9 protein [Chloroflexota bacterium]
MRAPERVLVVKLATLGDLLTITPALRALRTSFPSAHVGVLTTPGGKTALHGLDTVDEVLTFDKFAFDRPADAARSLPRAVQLAGELRAADWDTLVLLHHLTTAFGTAKYAALSLGSGAPRRVGLDNGRGQLFLTHSAVDHGFGWHHEVDYWLDVVGVLGAQHPGTPRLELASDTAADAWAASRSSELDPRNAVLLVPGSGAYSKARRWSPERFVQVAQSMQKTHGLQPRVLSGLDPDEQLLAEHIAHDIGAHARVVPAAPTPQALGALIRQFRLVIANDSGPVHVATAVGTPVVAIFGPSNDRAWGPYPPSDPAHQVVHEVVACAPCIHRGHDFGTPQGCPARTCLAILDVVQVEAAAERALTREPQVVGSR